MKFQIGFNRTPLCDAIEEQNVEIVQLLLNCNKVNINLTSVFEIIFHTILSNIF